MNPHPPPPDRELEQLLAAQVRHTTPEFEHRWRELRRGFTGADRRWRAWPWVLWPAIAAASAAAFMVIAPRRPPQAVPAPGPVSFEELIALDDALARAEPLLVSEDRDAVLHLPVDSP